MREKPFGGGKENKSSWQKYLDGKYLRRYFAGRIEWRFPGNGLCCTIKMRLMWRLVALLRVHTSNCTSQAKNSKKEISGLQEYYSVRFWQV